MKKSVTRDRSNGQTSYVIVSNDGLCRGLYSYLYFKKRLNEKKLAGKVKLELAGLILSKDVKPNEPTVKALKKKGFSPTGYTVKQISEDLLSKTDVLITASQEDYHYVKHTYKALPRKVRVLNVPVVLPAAKEESYEKAFDKIAKGIDQLVQSL